MTLTHEQALDLAAGYVLGALEPDEEQAVREHLATCPASHAEFAELGSVVGVLAESVEQVEPPAALRARILAAATAASISPPPSIPFPSPEERDARAAERADRIRGGSGSSGRAATAARGSSRGEWLLRAAAILAIVALGAWNVVLQRDLAADRDYRAGVAAVLDVAAGPGATVTILVPTGEGRPGGMAAVGADGRVAVVLRDLAPLSGSEVYEAWVIVAGDQAPLPVGAFKPGPNGTATFVSQPTPAGAGATVALTREPGPGATAPTAPILSSGQTAPQGEG